MRATRAAPLRRDKLADIRWITLAPLGFGRRQLLKDPRVIFAGYKMPHRTRPPAAPSRPLSPPRRPGTRLIPLSLFLRAAALEHLFRLRIQTRADSTPQEALTEAINALILEVNKMEDQFRDQKAEFQQRNPQPMNEGI